MKTLRISFTLLIAVLVLSVWTPAKASEQAEETQQGLAVTGPTTKYVTLTVYNQTGGSLYVKLNILRYRKDPTPRQDYFLLANKPGRNQFLILPGRYIYTIWASNCGGQKMNTKVFNGAITLGPFFCDR